MTLQNAIPVREAGAETELEAAAVRLALANASAEGAIQRVYWFPDERQIRLVEVDELLFRRKEDEEDDEIHPFYFAPVKGVPFPAGIALIHPDEDRKKRLPPEWETDWGAARIVFERGERDAAEIG